MNSRIPLTDDGNPHQLSIPKNHDCCNIHIIQYNIKCIHIHIYIHNIRLLPIKKIKRFWKSQRGKTTKNNFFYNIIGNYNNMY